MKNILLILIFSVATSQAATTVLSDTLEQIGLSVSGTEGITAPNVTITAESPSNQLLIFDSSVPLPNGEDSDLFVGEGYAVAISEGGRFDDEAEGGTIVFNFEQAVTRFEFIGIDYDHPVTVSSVTNGVETNITGFILTPDGSATNLIEFDFSSAPVDEIRFNLSASGAVGGIAYDVVPEPSSLLMTSLALGLFILRRKR